MFNEVKQFLSQVVKINSKEQLLEVGIRIFVENLISKLSNSETIIPQNEASKKLVES